MQVSSGKGDHCNPVMAIDSLGTLYAAWQENARGVWDVCLATCVDGRTWSAPVRITDSNEDHVNPAIAAGTLPSGLVAVTWQAGPAGRQEIYVARSMDAFASADVSQVTHDDADQSEPAVAVDAGDTVFVVWTDGRNATSDLYGAASKGPPTQFTALGTPNDGPWANAPLVNIDSDQSQPAVAIDSTGRMHIVWVDDIGGDTDVFYAASDGLPTEPLTGMDIVDDESGADQQSPAIAVARGADGAERAIACWVDGRNGNADLCLADLSADSTRANALINDGGAAGNQREVSLGTDGAGSPYLVCTDDTTGNSQVYCSGTMGI